MGQSGGTFSDVPEDGLMRLSATPYHTGSSENGSRTPAEEHLPAKEAGQAGQAGSNAPPLTERTQHFVLVEHSTSY